MTINVAPYIAAGHGRAQLRGQHRPLPRPWRLGAGLWQGRAGPAPPAAPAPQAARRQGKRLLQRRPLLCGLAGQSIHARSPHPGVHVGKTRSAPPGLRCRSLLPCWTSSSSWWSASSIGSVWCCRAPSCCSRCSSGSSPARRASARPGRLVARISATRAAWSWPHRCRAAILQRLRSTSRSSCRADGAQAGDESRPQAFAEAPPIEVALYGSRPGPAERIALRGRHPLRGPCLGVDEGHRRAEAAAWATAPGQAAASLAQSVPSSQSECRLARAAPYKAASMASAKAWGLPRLGLGAVCLQLLLEVDRDRCDLAACTGRARTRPPSWPNPRYRRPCSRRAASRRRSALQRLHRLGGLSPRPTRWKRPTTSSGCSSSRGASTTP